MSNFQLLGYSCDLSIPKDWKNVAQCGQSHSDEVFFADTQNLFHETADAMITKEKKFPLCIRTADCLAIILYDPVKEVLAHIHAGWRGQSLRIVSKTLKKMQKLGCQASDILAYSSPSLGVCCAQFSDPVQELPEWMHPFVAKENKVDFKKALRSELLANGVRESNIEISPLCTCCSPDFLSYRRDKTDKRMYSLVWMK